MNTKDGSGPAFPHPNPNFHQDWGYHQTFGGMSLRDWFAGQALSGFLANSVPINGITERTPELMATVAYAVAAAMLIERAK